MILSMDFRLIESSDFCLYLYSILVFLYFLNINSFVTNFVPQLIPISLRCVDVYYRVFYFCRRHIHLEKF